MRNPMSRKLVKKGFVAITTSLGWHNYYVKRFNLNQSPDAEHLAMYYLLLALRDGELS